ncbi:MAG: D-alanine--D-alanine ligase [Zetaproteobacteria bacterium]|nr:MAG: D-alanine--D-alanine ligase [Zetaproteobacteria bacterium]
MSRVGVLMGGISSEREISLRSGMAVLGALKRCGIDAVGIELQGRQWVEQIRKACIDRAFIALHGQWGEDGCVQGMLEIMGIPYTGSGVTSSALCMNKRLCKAVLNQHGVKTPVEIPLLEHGPVRYPVIVKPVAEGSSIGLHLFKHAREWEAAGLNLHPGQWMAEMPVAGPEVAVSVLDGEALPPVEVVPKRGSYDFRAKYTTGATDYFCPARLPAETLGHCMEVAERAINVLGCSGAPRVDMIVADGGEPHVLEINTIPGMTETSLLPKAAAAAGIDFDALCRRILDMASLEHPLEERS